MNSIQEDYCQNFVNEIFQHYDKDKSNTLDRSQLKLWLNRELQNKPKHKGIIMKQFSFMVHNADKNLDKQIDKMQLYEYCLKNSQ